MAKGQKRRGKNRKEEIILTPEEKFAQLLALKKATRCIIGIEDEYKIYERLTKEFAELGKKAETEPFEGCEQCGELSEECRKKAEELKTKLPKNKEEQSQTVTTTAKEREMKGKEKKGRGKWIALAVIVLVITVAICYKTTPTRYLIAGAERRMGLNKYAMESYDKLGDYKDSAEKTKEAAYAYAVSLQEDKDYSLAHRKFSGLADAGYKDSAEKELQIEKILLADAKQGKLVTFGSDRWLVLDKKEDKVLLARYYAIDDMPYHTAMEKITWENCSLRQYLNDKFLKDTFTDKEQEIIEDTRVANGKNSTYGTDGGKDTTDKVFILDEREARQYADVLKKKNKSMRLRTPGRDQTSTVYISYLQEVIDYGFPVAGKGACIRPVIWVKYQ